MSHSSQINTPALTSKLQLTEMNKKQIPIKTTGQG